jgi:hypothetical protein
LLFQTEHEEEIETRHCMEAVYLKIRDDGIDEITLSYKKKGVEGRTLRTDHILKSSRETEVKQRNRKKIFLIEGK